MDSEPAEQGVQAAVPGRHADGVCDSLARLGGGADGAGGGVGAELRLLLRG